MIIAVNGAFGQQTSLFRQTIAAKKAAFPTIYQAAFYHPQQVPVLPQNFYCSQLGFFCKQELKFESVTKIPFKFRLGSIQYNDWMEGKINAGILPVR